MMAAWLRIGLAVVLLARPAVALGQHVVLAGQGAAEIDRRLERLIRAGDFLLVTRDTLIAAGDSTPRSLLVVDATLTLEGAVAGDVVGVESNLFVRPTARVHGDVVNIAGGLYPSDLAAIDGTVVDAPRALYSVVRERDGTIRIEAEQEAPSLELHGVYGFRAPTYQRVDALTTSWGAEYHLPALGRLEPALDGWIGYASGRGALQGGVALMGDLGQTSVALGGEKLTATNDAWIRSDLRNSISFLVNDNDYRNYYEARYAYAELAHEFGGEEHGLTARLRAQYERDKSLAAGEPWVVFPDSVRPNPPIDDGTIASAIVGVAGDWVGLNAAAEYGLDLEFAGQVLNADFSFSRFAVWGKWAMDALADNLLEVEWRFQGPLPGTRTLPPQRWTIIGGSGTLNTFDIGQFRGDRLVFAKTRYTIPLPERLRLPIIGAPDLQLRYAVGMAWTETIRRDLEQNVGIQLQFLGPYVRVMTNPTNPIDDMELNVGVSWPFGGGRPWRQRE